MAEISCGLYSRPVTGIFTRLPYQAFAIFIECHDRRQQSPALRSGDYGWVTAFHHSYNAVGCSQVNTNNF